MPNKKNITILDMQPILPAVSGGRLRLLGLYSGFSNEFELKFIGSYDWEGEKFRQTQINHNFSEVLIPMTTRHFLENDKMGVYLPGKNIIDISFPILFEHSPELINIAKKNVMESEIVVFSHPWMFYAVSKELDSTQMIVYDAQNFEGILRASLLGFSSGTEKIIREVIRVEYELSNVADLILCCSPEDMKYFNEIYGIPKEKLYLASNGVFSEDYKIIDYSKRDKLKKKYGLKENVAVFVGSDYAPNLEAANQIINIANKLPEVDFVIVGGVGEKITNDIPSNIIVTGFLDENKKKDYLNASDVALNPILSGSGTNIKLLEYMAMGKPILTTKKGARGFLNLSPLPFVVSEISNFCSDLSELLKDESRLSNLSRISRGYADIKFNWTNISRDLEIKISQEYKKKKKLSIRL